MNKNGWIKRPKTRNETMERQRLRDIIWNCSQSVLRFPLVKKKKIQLPTGVFL